MPTYRAYLVVEVKAKSPVNAHAILTKAIHEKNRTGAITSVGYVGNHDETWRTAWVRIED